MSKESLSQGTSAKTSFSYWDMTLKFFYGICLLEAFFLFLLKKQTNTKFLALLHGYEYLFSIMRKTWFWFLEVGLFFGVGVGFFCYISYILLPFYGCASLLSQEQYTSHCMHVVECMFI